MGTVRAMSLREADELRIRLSWRNGWKYCAAPSGPFGSPCHTLIDPSEVRWAVTQGDRIPVCQSHWQQYKAGQAFL
jgi:hypothetical protein